MNNRYLLGLLLPLLNTYNKISGSNNNSVSVLNYHAIPENYFINFKKQIDWLYSNYNIIDSTTFHSFLEGKVKLNGHNILITFDDGFLSSYNAIKDVLNPKYIKTLLFIPTGFINSERNFNWKEYVSNNIYNGRISENDVADYYKPMTYKEVNELINEGHQIGGHTIMHNNLAEISDPNILHNEIVTSKMQLEMIFNIEINSFAYPFGGIKNINTTILKEIIKHYSYSYSNIRGSNSHNNSCYTIRRQNITPELPVNYFGFIVEGGLNWLWVNHLHNLDGFIQ